MESFKKVNVLHGHPEGDTVLCHVARALQRAVRSTDLVGRMGGGEFVACLPGLSSRSEITQCIQRPYQVISQYPDPALILTCSVGIAVCPADDCTFEALLKKADDAMYHAKGNGKGSFYFWDSINIEIGPNGH